MSRNDLRLAARQIVKNPGFSAVVIGSLALAIGANTAIFTLVNAVLLRSLPVKDPQELVLLRTIDGVRGRMSRGGENVGFTDPATGRFGSTSFSVAIFDRLRAEQSALADIFAFAPFSQVNVLVDGAPELNASAQLVSGTYYAGLGVPAIIGRVLTEEDDRPGAAPAAVISFRFWDRRFARDPQVLGKAISINRVPTTIVGVTPQGFDGTMQVGESADVSVPLASHLRFQPDRAARARPSYWWVRIMGRLAPGATSAQVRAMLEPPFQIAAREGWIADASPGSPSEEMPDAPTLAIDPAAQGENDARQQFAAPLQAMMGLVLLVLAAACANVANLLLARGVTRRHEIAVRLALGASRANVVRQLLAESLVLAVASAILGVLLAWWTRGALLSLRSFGRTPITLDLPLDLRVSSFTIIVTLATVLIFGVVPALRASRVDPAASLGSGARTLGNRHRSRLSQALMIVQVAVSLVLLVSTGLFVRSVQNLEHVDAGFNRRNLVLFRIDASSAGYARDQVTSLQTRLQERVARIPGAQSVTFSNVALLSSVRQNKRVTIPGHTVPPGVPTNVNTNGVAPNFFEALQLPIVRGRGFTESDDEAAPRVAVVNQAFVGTYLDGEDPVGQTIIVGRAPTDRVEVVGVARDAKYTDLRGAAPATIYFPARQRVDGDATFAIRLAPRSGIGARQAYAAAFAEVRAAVRAIDPALPALDLRTQDEQVDRLHAQPILFARLSAAFGVVAIALAAVGLYGLMAHAVARRTGEIGLRMALGAGSSGVVRMLLSESLSLVGIGVVVGAAAAFGAAHVVAAMLFGLSPADPVTYATAAAVLVGTGVFASLLPAWRASRIDPLVALKVE